MTTLGLQQLTNEYEVTQELLLAKTADSYCDKLSYPDRGRCKLHAKSDKMKIAVEGCCHGELDKIYETLQFLEEKEGIKVDLLLCCGDFQAVRNHSDLQCMAVPPKYQRMNTFWKYYSGEKKAPVLTIFIGGNHEASNYLQELPYGGWVAEKIYYLGYAGIINIGGIRIGGLSGIYKGRDYNKGHFEFPPYSEDTKRTAYHIRNLEVFRLKQIQKPIDVFMTHDWPRGIYNYGNTDALLRKKQFFREEVENGTLGSLPAEELLFKLKPDYWFSAHLHVKFAAVVQHQLDDGTKKSTKFLSLDKCLPRRQFLQVVDFPRDETQPLHLSLDPEWLSILKSTDHLLNLSRTNCFMPGPGCKERYDFSPSEDDIKKITADFGDDLTIPDNFEPSAPVHKENGKVEKVPPKLYVNPQTTLLCEMLDLSHPNSVFSGKKEKLNLNVSVPNPEEINLGDDEEDDVPDETEEPDEDYTFLESSVEGLDTSVYTPDVSTNNSANVSSANVEDDFNDPAFEINRTKFSTPLSLGKPVGINPSEISLIEDEEENDTGLESGSQCATGDSDTQSNPSGFELGTSGISERSFDRSADESALESSASELDSSKTDAESVQPKLKKFKRRNHAIYTSNEED